MSRRLLQPQLRKDACYARLSTTVFRHFWPKYLEDRESIYVTRSLSENFPLMVFYIGPDSQAGNETLELYRHPSEIARAVSTRVNGLLTLHPNCR